MVEHVSGVPAPQDKSPSQRVGEKGKPAPSKDVVSHAALVIGSLEEIMKVILRKAIEDLGKEAGQQGQKLVQHAKEDRKLAEGQ